MSNGNTKKREKREDKIFEEIDNMDRPITSEEIKVVIKKDYTHKEKPRPRWIGFTPKFY